MSLLRENQKNRNIASSRIKPAHSPFSYNNERAQELRKTLFPSARRVPGRKVKMFLLAGLLITLEGNYKMVEAKRNQK